MRVTGFFISWPEALARLRELWAEGLSTTLIAERLSAEFPTPVTKNTVIGKAHRLGLAPRSNPILRAKKPKALSPVSKNTRRAIAHTVVRVNKAVERVRAEMATPGPSVRLIPPTSANLAVLGTGKCQYPAWDDRHKRWSGSCGKQAVAKSSWCPGHYVICHERAPAKRVEG